MTGACAAGQQGADLECRNRAERITCFTVAAWPLPRPSSSVTMSPTPTVAPLHVHSVLSTLSMLILCITMGYDGSTGAGKTHIWWLTGGLT